MYQVLQLLVRDTVAMAAEYVNGPARLNSTRPHVASTGYEDLLENMCRSLISFLHPLRFFVVACT